MRRRVDAVLDALGLERRPPDGRFFEDVFLRFQRRIACETLTRPAGDPQAFDAERFFAEWVEEERGLVGAERARAFELLARELGFDVSLVHGTCVHPWEAPERHEVRRSAGDGGSSSKVNGVEAHRTVLASIEGRRILADAAFPLPVLLKLDPPAQEIPTGMGSLSATVAPDASLPVTCDARGEVAELLHVFPAPSDPSLPLEEISRRDPIAQTRRETPRGPAALRVLDDRVLFWSAGRMTILDAWSRLEYALPASERSAIEKLFALELGDVVLPGEADEDPAKSATLSVFHLSPVTAEEVRRRIARETPPYSLVASRELRVEKSGAGTRLGIHATLAGPMPPAGPGEAVRKTLVFHLVSELFELSRG